MKIRISITARWFLNHWQAKVFGVALFALAAAWWWGPLGFLSLSAVSPVLAALLAGIVVFSINETVSERRAGERAADTIAQDRERESRVHEKRVNVYYELLEHVLGSFSGTAPKRSEVSIRPLIAVWGSEEFTTAYQNWRSSIEGLAGTGRAVAIPSDRKRPIQGSLAGLVATVKKDLGKCRNFHLRKASTSICALPRHHWPAVATPSTAESRIRSLDLCGDRPLHVSPENLNV
ncbi:hypothetical protein [Nesterenkonia natronophila]|uniref:hypothetical protein n=1 Tax=Nesterenkonia natronophila TaxID=2174932 RepID=UPI0011C3772A|nr:hypothetical protein [Nesterenkonia natronophila]